MKKFLLGTAATAALMAIASPASAQTDVHHYAATVPVFGNLTSNNPGPIETAAWNLARGFLNIGTRYTAHADAPSDSVTATPIVEVAFTLKGSVNKDCSFYSGNNASARNIDFGVIGVRTGDNENVNRAFEMVGDAEAEIETLTAGCNFNNEVKIVKSNVNGMVNSAAGGYDSNQFQANIPYSVNAAWTGVAFNTVAAGSAQSLNVATNALSGVKQQGAWRSSMTIDIEAPAITSKALVAGNYQGTATLTLTAL